MPRLTQLCLATARHIKEIRVNRHFRYGMARPGTLQSQMANLPGKERPPVIVRPIKEWQIHLGDLVHILKGKDIGKQGLICDIIKERNWVVVEGLNCCYKMVGKMEGLRGTMVVSEMPLDYFDVALIDPSDNQPTDVQLRYTEAGDRVRVSKRTGRVIPIPAKALLNPDEPDPAKYTDQPKDTAADMAVKKTYNIENISVEDDLMDKCNIIETRKRAKTYWY
ncbi:large ribosomal subunit protein uL24m-like [Antedon mediterranea]|uniref:large ribosomal subunit protein uL24m-like n=1 Tax=Antedon mediterranea TaxID=105859 RepID=UPI003AF77EB0